MTQEELNKHIDAHEAWLDGKLGGARFYALEASAGNLEASGRRLDRSCWQQAECEYMQFDKASLRGADFRNARLSGVNFVGADLADAYFGRTNLQRADFQGANLDRATFYQVDLHRAQFSPTDRFYQTPWGLAHIRADHIRIGCQYYHVSRWAEFDDYDIRVMAYGALPWWKEHKDTVLYLAEQCKPYEELLQAGKIEELICRD